MSVDSRPSVRMVAGQAPQFLKKIHWRALRWSLATEVMPTVGALAFGSPLPSGGQADPWWGPGGDGDAWEWDTAGKAPFAEDRAQRLADRSADRPRPGGDLRGVRPTGRAAVHRYPFPTPGRSSTVPRIGHAEIDPQLIASHNVELSTKNGR